jgi:hypothetical protein
MMYPTMSFCTLLFFGRHSEQERLTKARNAFLFLRTVGMMHSDGLTLTHFYLLLLFTYVSRFFWSVPPSKFWGGSSVCRVGSIMHGTFDQRSLAFICS